MTCQECELALAGEDRGSLLGVAVDEHVASCAACREFGIELRENSEALRAFATEAMPALPRALPMPMPRRQQVAWWGAVAAMLMLGFVTSWKMVPRRPPGLRHAAPIISPDLPAGQIASVSSVEPPRPKAVSDQPLAQFRPAAAPVGHRGPGRSRQDPLQRSNEPRILQVKMLTDDPDVVIYWQIEN